MKRGSFGSARRQGFVLVAAFVAGSLLLASSASADTLSGDQLATFMPQPASPFVSEMIWNGSELYEGPGAIGTGFGTGGSGDGELPVNQQFVPGLSIETPFVVNGVPGSLVNVGDSSTSFYDATLDIIPIGGALRGLPALGSVLTWTLPVSGETHFVQELGAADFNIWSTDPVEAAGPDTENPVLLLAGTIDYAYITGSLNASGAGVLSADVTYTSGKIMEAAGFTEVMGSLSWSLLDATPKYHVVNDQLAPFEANAVGQFSAIPEPATALLLLSGIPFALAGWRRWRIAR